MKGIAIVAGIISLIVFAGMLATPCLGIDVTPVYASSIRSSLFSGFLSLGGFLLSLKTFTVVKMKEGLFDTKEYIQRVKEQRVLNKKLTVYGPLKRLSNLLFVAIISSIITAILQLTLGLWNRPEAAAICLGAAAFTLTYLVASLIQIKANLDAWFETLEKHVLGERPGS